MNTASPGSGQANPSSMPGLRAGLVQVAKNPAPSELHHFRGGHFLPGGVINGLTKFRLSLGARKWPAGCGRNRGAGAAGRGAQPNAGPNPHLTRALYLLPPALWGNGPASMGLNDVQSQLNRTLVWRINSADLPGRTSNGIEDCSNGGATN